MSQNDDSTGSTFLVDPRSIAVNDSEISDRSVRVQMAFLKERGQIEPIILTRTNRVCICGICNWTAPAQLVAAREMKWETVLCAYHSGRG
jgi:hypothetical protein